MSNTVTELWNADIFVARTTMTKERAIELIAEYEIEHGREPQSYTLIPAYAAEQIARDAVKRGECMFISARGRGRPKVIRPGMEGLKVHKTASIDVTTARLVEQYAIGSTESAVFEDSLELLRDEKASGMTHEEVRALIQGHNEQEELARNTSADIAVAWVDNNLNEEGEITREEFASLRNAIIEGVKR